MYAELIKAEPFFDLNELRAKTRLIFDTPDNIAIGNLPVRCELSISEYSPDRNENQNAKYWKIVGDIARTTGQSKTVVHNQLLNDYGEMEIKNGEPTIVVMPETFNYLEDEDLHLMPTGKRMRQGDKIYCIYFKLINSKNLTKKQFSRLLDGALYEKENL